MVMVIMCTFYLMPFDSFFAHYMPRFMHLWWLLIVIWISHDILRAVSYFLYHYYFINLQIACKGMLTNTAKHWLPSLAMNLENFKKYLQVCFNKTFRNIIIESSNPQESTIHGIRYWVDGENWLHRIVWMFLVGCSVAFLALLVKDAYM